MLGYSLRNNYLRGYGMGQLMFVIGSFASLWALAAWLACGIFAGHIAAEKNRCGFCWFCWGILFGPIGLIASVGLPVRDPSSGKEKTGMGMFSQSNQSLPVHILESREKQ